MSCCVYVGVVILVLHHCILVGVACASDEAMCGQVDGQSSSSHGTACSGCSLPVSYQGAGPANNVLGAGPT